MRLRFVQCSVAWKFTKDGLHNDSALSNALFFVFLFVHLLILHHVALINSSVSLSLPFLIVKWYFLFFLISHKCNQTFSLPSPAGTAHSKEWHEQTPARVHGDVLDEERSRCSDGDLQETHHTERRQVTHTHTHSRWKMSFHLLPPGRHLRLQAVHRRSPRPAPGCASPSHRAKHLFYSERWISEKPRRLIDFRLFGSSD